MGQHGDLGDAGKGAGLAPRKILQAPEIGDRIDGQHGRGIVALLLDQLRIFGGVQVASSAIGGMAALSIRIGLLLLCFGRRLIPPIAARLAIVAPVDCGRRSCRRAAPAAAVKPLQQLLHAGQAIDGAGP
jgi:hypothetical protein